MTEGKWLGKGEWETEEMEWGSLATFLTNYRARLKGTPIGVPGVEMGPPSLAVHFYHWARRVLPDDWSPLFQCLCVRLRLQNWTDWSRLKLLCHILFPSGK